MVLFALSCFGLLLFLWLSFGGPIPLKPEKYRFQAAFPEATTLGQEADVRTAGVSIGKVVDLNLDPKGNRTMATIELDRRAAPIRSNAKAILRQKTLLGETYVELTPGTTGAPYLKEGHLLPRSQVEPTVELDELVRAFNGDTRNAFHLWQQVLAQGIDRRAQDLSDAFGNLPPFADSATGLLKVLNQEGQPLHRLVRDTGVVFGALTQDENALHGVIVNSEGVFGTLARQNVALAEVFHIFPTFLDESKKTYVRLKSFALDTHPLIKQLRPVARDLRPALASVKRLAPDLRRLFVNLGPLIAVSKKGLPALRDTLHGTTPLLGATGSFVSQLNPVLSWIQLYQHQITDFISLAEGGLAAHVTSRSGGIGHYLRQTGPQGMENFFAFSDRDPGNRGNTYLPPLALSGPDIAKKESLPSWDCNNVTPGRPDQYTPLVKGDGSPANPGAPSCWVAAPLTFRGKKQGRFSHVDAAKYGG